MVRRFDKAYFCPRCGKTGRKPKIFIAKLDIFWKESWRDRSRKYLCSSCAVSLREWWYHPQQGAAEAPEKAQTISRTNV